MPFDLNIGRRNVLSAAALAITSLQAGNSAETNLPKEGTLPSLTGATGWLNSPPLTPAALKGKVVVIDFWTFSCINWLRTLPYTRAWSEKYTAQGLVILGVHTPEFSFEADIENVRRTAGELAVPYPIAIDSNYSIWRAFQNNSWPARYIVDAAGQIRYHHFGEGQYERSEAVMQQLLSAAGNSFLSRNPVSVTGRGLEAPADWNSMQSPENYFGSQRTANLVSSPARLRLNQWAHSGEWKLNREAAHLKTAGGQIAYRFEARDLHMVLGPAAPGAPVRFRVRLDGQQPGPAHGLDVDEQGNGTIITARLYQLIRQQKPIFARHFEIEFFDAGAEAFSVSFG